MSSHIYYIIVRVWRKDGSLLLSFIVSLAREYNLRQEKDKENTN